MKIIINKSIIKRNAEKIAIKGLSYNQTTKGVGVVLDYPDDGTATEQDFLDGLARDTVKSNSTSEVK